LLTEVQYSPVKNWYPPENSSFPLVMEGYSPDKHLNQILGVFLWINNEKRRSKFDTNFMQIKKPIKTI
ncbi:hypothetical protein V7157_22980, partial [Neobacillus drentensis]|uniref:hypothetical protein n=1 Tax=Neobacillus drentensis TaxID=220684 RepID=UPI0030023B1F